MSPRELFILEAVYTDGETQIPVTPFVNTLVRDNALNIYINEMFLGVSIESSRLKILTVKYQTPDGVYFCYALQNENLILDQESTGHAGGREFELLGAYYGNETEYSSVMHKMEHYEYFKWDQIPVNHESFPSNSASDNINLWRIDAVASQGADQPAGEGPCPGGGKLPSCGIDFGEHG